MGDAESAWRGLTRRQSLRGALAGLVGLGAPAGGGASPGPSGIRCRRCSRAKVRSGADLRNCDLKGQRLAGRDLSGANLAGACLSRANLQDANLVGANLDGADLSGANLDQANLLHASTLRWVTDAATSFHGATAPDGSFCGGDDVVCGVTCLPPTHCCAGRKPLDPAAYVCCASTVWGGDACCGGIGYASSRYTCCGSQICSRAAGCCGDRCCS